MNQVHALNASPTGLYSWEVGDVGAEVGTHIINATRRGEKFRSYCLVRAYLFDRMKSCGEFPTLGPNDKDMKSGAKHPQICRAVLTLIPEASFSWEDKRSGSDP